MARRDNDDDDDKKPEPKKKGKLVPILIAVLVLGAGGGGAAWYMKKDAGAESEESAPKEKNASFINMEAFTVNLAAENEDQVLQVGLTLKVTSSTTAESMKGYMPEIRSKILLLLSDKKGSEINTSEGKQQLRTELLKTIKETITSPRVEQEITEVLFTSFVIQ